MTGVSREKRIKYWEDNKERCSCVGEVEGVWYGYGARRTGFGRVRRGMHGMGCFEGRD